jgi:hypothetical protein
MLLDAQVALTKVHKHLRNLIVLGLPAFKPGDKVKLDLSKDSLGGV